MRSQDPPRVLGILVSLHGLLLMGAGLYANVYWGGGATYYVIVGLGEAISGILLFQGNPTAIAFYGVTLLTVWIWSAIEVGTEPKKMLPSVTVPTLLGLYIFSPLVRSRLEVDHSKPSVHKPLSKKGAMYADLSATIFTNAIRLAPRVLTWFVLVYATKN